MARVAEMWTGVGPFGSSLASIVFIYTMIERYFPNRLRSYILKYVHRILAFTNNIRITVHEYTGDLDITRRNVAYSAIEAYLSSKSTKDAKRFTAQVGRNGKKLVLTMDDNECMNDEFQGAKLCWYASKTVRETKSSYITTTDVKRSFTLEFHQRYRDMVTDLYLTHVMEKGMMILTRNRQRKLYTNCRYGQWSHVVLDHPATFDNLAMDPLKKKEILEDLMAFSKGKQYYAKVGKAWKRGYLLYGPPGTGKSTMIAAMANFMNYDIYDLELTAVQGNSELRKLLLETSNKSVIVIEDIDCSLGLARKREIPKDKEEKDKKGDKEQITEQNLDNKVVTLSGLLNFIDGLWSTCGRERLIVFTTNYKEKLDPALIRRGRMDKHIELSYCCFEGFKILANNYLNLDSHHLFETIFPLINETQITPADVAEILMPKTNNEDDAEVCLKDLIRALEKRKADAELKAKEDANEKLLTSKEGEAKQRGSSNAVGTNFKLVSTLSKDKGSGTRKGKAQNCGSSTEDGTNEEDKSKRSKDVGSGN